MDFNTVLFHRPTNVDPLSFCNALDGVIHRNISEDTYTTPKRCAHWSPSHGARWQKGIILSLMVWSLKDNGRSKRRVFLSLVFITKSISKKLLIKKMISFHLWCWFYFSSLIRQLKVIFIVKNIWHDYTLVIAFFTARGILSKTVWFTSANPFTRLACEQAGSPQWGKSGSWEIYAWHLF